MPQISKEIEKLESIQLDAQLQKRLSKINVQMKGLDSSSEKYNKLVKEVLELHIKQLEIEKKKLKEAANVEQRLVAQKNIRALENKTQLELNTAVKKKLDPKVNSELKSKVNLTTLDIEQAFDKLIKSLDKILTKLSKTAVNVSKKDIVHSAKKAKQDKQEEVYYERTNSSPKTDKINVTAEIAQAEIDKLLKSEKVVAKELKDAILEVNEEIDRAKDKDALAIQNKKLELLVQLYEKNNKTFKKEIAKELENVFQKTQREARKKESGFTRGGKLGDINRKAKEVELHDKLAKASDSFASGLGKLDSELGSFAESIFSGIANIYKFGESLSSLPSKIDSVKDFYSGVKSILGGKSQSGSIIDKEAGFDRVAESVDELGQKIIDLQTGKSSLNPTTAGKPLSSVLSDKNSDEDKKSPLSKITAETAAFGLTVDSANESIKVQSDLTNNLNFAMSKSMKIFRSFGRGLLRMITSNKYISEGYTKLTKLLTAQSGKYEGVVSWLGKLSSIIKKVIIGFITLNRSMLFKAASDLGSMLVNLLPVRFVKGFSTVFKGLLAGGRGFLGLFRYITPLLTGFGAVIARVVPLIISILNPFKKFFLLLGLIGAAGALVAAAFEKIGSWFGGSDEEKTANEGLQSPTGRSSGGASGAWETQGSSNAQKRKIKSNGKKKADDLMSTPDSELTPGERTQKQREQRKAYLRPRNKFLGEIAAKSESGNNGSIIGKEATGHNSYGMYQIHHNNMDKFVAGLNESDRAALQAAGPVGSAGFNAKWKEIGNSESMRAAQQEYIERTHYNPLMNSLENSGIDLSNRGKGVQELIFSTSVQEGSGTKTIHNALKNIDPKELEGMSDADLINKISEYKKNNVQNKFRTHISKGGDTSGIYKRIEEEKQVALAYENEKLKTATDQNSELMLAQQQKEMRDAMSQGINPNQPAPIVLAQNGIGGSDNTQENAWGPIDLRNLESTFIRNMDRDYSLIR